MVSGLPIFAASQSLAAARQYRVTGYDFQFRHGAPVSKLELLIVNLRRFLGLGIRKRD